MVVLKLIIDAGGRERFQDIKKEVTGYSGVSFRRMGWEKKDKVDSVHKSLARATKTLEDKGLITRQGWEGQYIKRYSKIVWMEITEQGREEYQKRVGVS